MGVLRALGTLYNSIIRNKIMKLDWEEFTADKVQVGRAIYALNQGIADDIAHNKVAFYIWTDASYYSDYTYKCGQTSRGLKRIPESATANGNPVVIVGWIPSDFARIKNYDQKIHKEHHDSGKATWLYKEDPNSSLGIEFSYYPDDNPVDLWRISLEGSIIRRELKLVKWQIEVLEWFGDQIDAGKKSIMAELAARFGKTLLYLVLHHLLEHRVMVVCSYYLSSFNSFKDEFYRYILFEDWIFLDASSEDFEQKYTKALNTNLKIVVFASLCGSSNVDKNSSLLKDFDSKFVVTDEADYGAHTPRSTEILNKIIGDSVYIRTTGTDSDRASRAETPDAFIAYSYPDMLCTAFC